MALSEKKIKYLIFPILFSLVLLPHYLYYTFFWFKYIYLIGVPLITIKQGFDIYKFNQKIEFIDFLAYTVIITTIVLSFLNLAFIEIFVWQITLGTCGVFIGLITEKKLIKNQFVKYWTRITFIVPFLFFLILKYQILS